MLYCCTSLKILCCSGYIGECWGWLEPHTIYLVQHTLYRLQATCHGQTVQTGQGQSIQPAPTPTSKDILRSRSLGAWNFSALLRTMQLGQLSFVWVSFALQIQCRWKVNTGISSEQNVRVVLTVGDELSQKLTMQLVVSRALGSGQELISSYFTGLDNEAWVRWEHLISTVLACLSCLFLFLISMLGEGWGWLATLTLNTCSNWKWLAKG